MDGCNVLPETQFVGTRLRVDTTRVLSVGVTFPLNYYTSTENVGLNKELLSNYRPIIQPPFIYKLLDKVDSKHAKHHLIENEMPDTHQSAYRPFHSSKTALTETHNNIATALDSEYNVALVTLDLSATFNLIDHQILHHCLKHTFESHQDH